MFFIFTVLENFNLSSLKAQMAIYINKENNYKKKIEEKDLVIEEFKKKFTEIELCDDLKEK